MKNKYTVETKCESNHNWYAYSEPNKKEALRFVKEVKENKDDEDTKYIRIRRNGWIIASWTRLLPNGVWHNSLLWTPLPK